MEVAGKAHIWQRGEQQRQGSSIASGVQLQGYLEEMAQSLKSIEVLMLDFCQAVEPELVQTA